MNHFTFDELSNDFFGTPGRTDKKVFHSRAKNLVALTSGFEFDSELMRDVHENIKYGLDYWLAQNTKTARRHLNAQTPPIGSTDDE